MEDRGYFYNLQHLVHEDVLKQRTKWYAGSDEWEIESSLTEYQRRLPGGATEPDTHGTSQCHPGHSEIVNCRMPQITSYSHCACPCLRGPPSHATQISSCLLATSAPSAPSLPVPLKHVTSKILAQGGYDNLPPGEKKAQKMGRLEPLIIFGLQFNLTLSHI